MTEHEFEVAKIILDKGLLALLAVIVGFWINKRLEIFRNEQGRINELERQRDTRAFDRKLDWYERIIRALHDMAQKIEIAATFEHESGDKEGRIGCWRGVQRAHLVLDALNDEAKLYGSPEAIKDTSRISKQVQDIADETDAFGENFEGKGAKEKLELIESLPDKLRKAAGPIAKEARSHLGLN